MAKKAKKTTEAPADKHGLDTLKDNARQAGRSTWLAGLGFVSRLGEEGRSAFDHLVEEGRKVEEKRVKPLAETASNNIDQLTGRVRKLGDRLVEKGRKVEEKRVKPLAETASKNIDQLTDRAKRVGKGVQAKVEDLAGGALHRMGVPTQSEITNLTAKVESLSEKLDRALVR